MGLITENNAHYYSGQQMYIQKTGTGTNVSILWEGDVILTATTGISNTNYRVTRNNIVIVEGTDYSLSNKSGCSSSEYKSDILN